MFVVPLRLGAQRPRGDRARSSTLHIAVRETIMLNTSKSQTAKTQGRTCTNACTFTCQRIANAAGTGNNRGYLCLPGCLSRQKKRENRKCKKIGAASLDHVLPARTVFLFGGDSVVSYPGTNVSNDDHMTVRDVILLAMIIVTYIWAWVRD